MYILGVSAYYHDSAAAILRNDEIIAAAQEERFTRIKQDSGFPKNAILYCLAEAGISLDQVDAIVFYDDPSLKFKRILKTYVNFFPKSLPFVFKSLPIWLTKKLYWKSNLIQSFRQELGVDVPKEKIKNTTHHHSHAASAFYSSPFNKAAVLVLDGVGEFETTTLWKGEGNKLTKIESVEFPHSIGLLYSAITSYIGFKVNSGEYKVMGLAPYGRPKYVDLIKNEIVNVSEDGTFQLDMDYFDFPFANHMTNTKFHKLFGRPPREPETEISQFEMDVARSIQDVTEEIVIKLARSAKKLSGLENICLAGGVALNCVANGKLLRENIFNNIWIQPAAGDAGGALGAAQWYCYEEAGNPRVADDKSDSMKGSYLGPSFSKTDIAEYLDSVDAVYTYYDDFSSLLDCVSDGLADEKVIGWHQGRMEFGPRSLGNRSILGDPRSQKMQTVMNLKIKYRESFRPFAPSVLREKVSDYFQIDVDSPYMLLVAPIKEDLTIKMSEEEQNLFGIEQLRVNRSTIPAVTHVDYSARIQTVHPETNSRYYSLIKAFEEKTGCSVVVNTSFNVRGEPIVCTPEDSYRCFMRTEMDILVIGDYVLLKENQPKLENDTNWKEEFQLD
ncbi:hypothetical protein CYQ88_00835 [Hydrogenovibrio sp. SC-1]|uniref:carbamoyltransferase family protein n=1 Tax=Hydrogenovibrio sp. SC-1 TaxID=2065820 RepID=UPI000C7E159C|nr:carbamoyltransferase [Hydrogenovibrio sp. SC-1]PLA75543.1 hypothetical protein CYQ88_00835 [Hydrogenovibrio sp. SC-1]